jgi:hypothetical protein
VTWLPTFTPTLVTPTDTPSITLTPSPTFETALNLTPNFNSTPRVPTTEFRLILDSAAANINSNGTAVPQAFTAGMKRVYLFISFENMENGVAWSRVLYRDGVPVQGNTLLWSLGESGSSYFFFGSQDGYPAGEYEVRLFVGEEEASRTAFRIESN